MSKRKKIKNSAPDFEPKADQGLDAFSYDNGKAVSATDMTGLTATMPQNDPEAAAYGEILNVAVKPGGVEKGGCKEKK